jgi:hypothetical protein
MINRNKIRCKKHLKHVASLPCLVCEEWNETVVPHHLLRFGGKGVGTKACDSLTVPLCHAHHSELHRMGDELAFFDMYGYIPRWVADMVFMICMTSPSEKIKDANILQNR